MSFQLAAKRARAPSSMVVLTRAALLLCLALLMSCGGGGGGGGGGNDPLRITLNRTSVSWTFLEGSTPTAETITGTATGSFDGTLYVGAIVENTGGINAIDPNIAIAGVGTQATATVFPAANLAAGTYTGRILFLVCSDPACNNRIGGTPLPVNFTVTVQPGVRAAPGSITRTIESGSNVVEDLAVTPGTGETGFTIGTTATFVQITNQTAGGFRVTLPSLPVGVYTANILLLGSNGSRSSIPISYTVTEPPGGQQPLSISTHGVTLTVPEGASSQPPHPQVHATEPTWRPGLQAFIEYREGQGWLGVTPVAGGFEFTANARNLSGGTYTAVVIIGGNPLPQGIEDPFRSAESVFVSLTVGPGLVQPADIVPVIDSEATLSALSGEVDIDLASGGPAVSWNASSDVPWLTVTPSGVTGATLAYSIDPTFLSTAANFAEHIATITVTAPATVISPMQFPVRVQRRLAEVTGVGAHIQASGQPTTLVVSGRGFGAVANPAARFSAAGASPTAVQRVSDAKLLVSFSALSAGTHVVSVNNALGFSTATRSAIAVTPTPYPYATVPSGGRIYHLAVDHETDTLYGVRLGFGGTPDQGTLVRFRPSGGNWVADSPAITAVDNVGVLLDGNVIVNTAPGGLTILDRDTMNPTFSLDLQCTGRHFRSANMPVTVDGRVWLSQAQSLSCDGSPTFGKLGWFDPATQSFQLFDVPHEPWFVQFFTNGPSFIMSRNGERLVMHQDSNQAFPPMVYLDATESVLRPTPLDQPGWFRFASASDDGSRILLDHDRLLNEQFATIGRASLPAYTLPLTSAAPVASVLSTDGSRAYVLTYPVSYLGQSPTPPTPLPRVWVLDTSGDVGDAPLPVLGYFELADYPNCVDDTNGACDFSLQAAISLDGHTLFFAGDQRLVVTPIPPEGTLNDAIAGPNSGQQGMTVPWHLPRH